MWVSHFLLGCIPLREQTLAPDLPIARAVGVCTQVVQVCAEHKKPRKLLKHLDAARAASQRQRHPPRCLIFTNKVRPVLGVEAQRLRGGGYRRH